MSGSSYPLSGDTRELLSQNSDFFQSLADSLGQTGLNLQGDDLEARVKRTENGDKIEVAFVYPLDDNKNPNDGRIYLGDVFVFDAKDGQFKEFKREFFKPQNSQGKNWEEWLQNLKKGKDPAPEDVKKFAATVARRFVGPEIWRSFDGKFFDALKSQEAYLRKVAQAASEKNPNLQLKIGDPQTHYAIQYLGDDIVVSVSYALDDDDKVLNGRVLLTDTFTLDGKTRAFKKHDRQWQLSPEAQGQSAWTETLKLLGQISKPSETEAKAFIEAIVPTLPLLSQEKFNQTVKKMSMTDAFTQRYQGMFERRAGQKKKETEVSANASVETLDMLYALAQERLEQRSDESKGWLSGGPKVNLQQEQAAFKSVFEKAQGAAKLGKVKNALAGLQAAASSEEEKKAVAILAEDRLCQQLSDAGQEPDAKLRHQTLIRFARSTLLMDHQLGSTAKFISDKLIDKAETKDRAKEVADLVEGKGSFGQKFELFSQQFVERSSDPAMLAAMTVAGVAGPTAELFGLKWFAGLGRFRNVAAAGLGIGTEALTFTTMHKIGEAAHHDPSRIFESGQYFKDFGSTASLFVGMRLVHFGTGLASTKLAESSFGQRLKLGTPVESDALSIMVGPTGRVLPSASKMNFTARGEWVSGAMNHVGGVLGMTGSSYLNQYVFHFQKPNKQGFWGNFNDALLMYGDSMVGFGIANRATGGKLQSTVGEMRFRIEAEKAGGTLLPGAASDPAAKTDPATPDPAVAATPGSPPPDPRPSIVSAVKKFFTERFTMKGRAKAAEDRATQLQTELSAAKDQAEKLDDQLRGLRGEYELARRALGTKEGEADTKVNNLIEKAEREKALAIALERQSKVDEIGRLESEKQALEAKVEDLEKQARQLPPAEEKIEEVDPKDVIAEDEAPDSSDRVTRVPDEPAADEAPTVVRARPPQDSTEDAPTRVRPAPSEEAIRLRQAEAELEQLREEKGELKSKLTALEAEKGEADESAGTMAEEAGKLRAKLRAAEAKAGEAQAKVDEAQVKVDGLAELRGELEAKTRRIADLELEVEQGGDGDRATLPFPMESVSLEFSERLAVAEARIAELEGQLASKQEKVLELEGQWAAKGEETQANSSRLTGEKEELSRKLRESQAEVKKLEIELKGLVGQAEKIREGLELKAQEDFAQKTRWEADLAAARGETSAEQGKREAAEAQATERNQELAAARARIEEIGQEIEGLKLTQTEELRWAAAEAQEAGRLLKEQYDAELARIQAEHLAERERGLAEVVEINGKKTEAEAEVSRLSAELEKIRGEKASGELAAAEKEATVGKELEVATRLVKSQSDKLKEAKTRLEKVEAAASQREMDLSQTIFGQQAELEAKQRAIVEQLAQLEQKNQKIEEQGTAIEGKDRTLDEQSSTIVARDARIETLEGYQRVKETRIERLSEDVQTLRLSLGRAEISVVELRTALEALTAKERASSRRVTELEKTVAELTVSRDKLATEVEDFKLKLAEMEIAKTRADTEGRRLSGELKTTQTQLEVSDKNLKKKTELAEELNQENLSLMEQLKGKENELERTQDKLTAREADLVRLRDQSAKNEAEAHSRIVKLSDAVDAKESETKDLQALLQDKIVEFAELQKQKNQAEQALGARQEDLVDMTQRYQREIKRADQTETERDLALRNLESEKSKVAEALRALSELSAKEKSLNEELEQTKQELEQEIVDKTDLSIELQSLTEEKERLKAEADGAIAGLKFSIGEKSEEISRLDEALKKETGRADRTASLGKRLGEDLKAAQTELTRLQEELKLEQQRAGKIGERLREVNLLLEQKSHDFNQEQQRVASLHKMIASTREARDASEINYRQTIEGLRASLKETQKLHEAGKAKIVVLESNLDRLQKDRTETLRPLQQRIRELEGTVKHQESQVEAAERKEQFLREQVELVRSELSRLNAVALKSVEILKADLEKQKTSTGLEQARSREIQAELRRVSTEYENSRTQAQSRLDHLEKALTEQRRAHEGAIKMYRTSQEHLETERGHKKQIVAQKDKKIGELESKIIKLEGDLAEEKENVIEAFHEAKRAETQHRTEAETQAKTILALEETLGKKLASIKKLNAMLEDEQGRGVESVRDMSGLHAQVEELQSEVVEVRRALNEEQQRAGRLEAAGLELERAVAEAQTRTEAAEADTGLAEAKLAHAMQKIEEQGLELESKQGEYEAALERISGYESKVRRLEDEKADQAGVIQDNEKEAGMLRRQIQEAGREQEGLERKKREAERKLGGAQSAAEQSSVAAARVPELERESQTLGQQLAEQTLALEQLQQKSGAANQAKASAEEAQRQAEVNLALEADKLREAKEQMIGVGVELDAARDNLNAAQEELSFYREVIRAQGARGDALWTDGASYPLTANSNLANTIGRATTCDIVIPERSVSRQNSHIWFDGQRWVIKDLGGSNGTRINGEILRAGDGWRELQDMDVIGFGYGEVTGRQRTEDERGNTVYEGGVMYGDPVLVFRSGSGSGSEPSLKEISGQQAHRLQKSRAQTDQAEPEIQLPIEDLDTGPVGVPPGVHPIPVPRTDSAPAPRAPEQQKTVSPAEAQPAPPAGRMYIFADVLKIHALGRKYKGELHMLYGSNAKEVAPIFQRLFANFPGLEERFNPDLLSKANDLKEQKDLFDDLIRTLEKHPRQAGDNDFFDKAKADIKNLSAAQKPVTAPSDDFILGVMRQYGEVIRQVFGIGSDPVVQSFAALYHNFPGVETVFNPKLLAEEFTPEKFQGESPDKIVGAIERYIQRKGISGVHPDRQKYNEADMAKESNLIVRSIEEALKARFAPENVFIPPQPVAQVQGHRSFAIDPRQGVRIERDFFHGDKEVSRHHADLLFNGAYWIYRDHSANGSLVNGQIVHNAERTLQEGDLIRFGDQMVNFNIVNGQAIVTEKYDFTLHSPFTLGHHPSNLAVVYGTDALPMHLQFDRYGNKWRVQDASRSGASLNGHRVQPGIPVVLGEGGLIGIGALFFQYLQQPDGSLRLVQQIKSRAATHPDVEEIPQAARPNANYVPGGQAKSFGPPEIKGNTLPLGQARRLIIRRPEGGKLGFFESPNGGSGHWTFFVKEQEKGFFEKAKNIVSGDKELALIEKIEEGDPGEAPKFRVTNLGYKDGIRVTNDSGKDLMISYKQNLYVKPGDRITIEGQTLALHP